VHAFGQDLEEAFEELAPFLGVELLGQLHRALTSANSTVTGSRSPSSAILERPKRSA
jgi:hypothetical protein